MDLSKIILYLLQDGHMHWVLDFKLPLLFGSFQKRSMQACALHRHRAHEVTH